MPANGHLAGGIAFMHPQSVALARESSGSPPLTISRRDWRGLRGELGLLPLDPAQLVDHGQPHGVIVDHQRCGDSHPAIRRIDAEVQVLDVLAHHLDGHAADREVVRFSSHAGSSPGRESGRPVHPGQPSGSGRSSSWTRLAPPLRLEPGSMAALIAVLTFLVLNGLAHASRLAGCAHCRVHRQRQRLVLVQVVVQRPLGWRVQRRRVGPPRWPGFVDLLRQFDDLAPDTPGSPAPPAGAARSGHRAAPTSSRSMGLIGVSSMISLRTLFSMVSATASLFLRDALG